MDDAFLVKHSYETRGHSDTKVIGIYSSYAHAEDAISKLRAMPGFKNYPNDFYIDKYPIDTSFWVEGFGE
ncbi:MAG: hypothetical protein H6969_06580 [Gammaproteobacteria bacterium]|nr:hypothetical protein [Gammaproteobacteria bacterium]